MVILTNGSALDCVGILNKCQCNGCHLDGGHVTNDSAEDGHVTNDSAEETRDGKDRLRCLFDLVLSGYVEEIASKGFVRPMPAILGNDGQSPDLLKLFLVVREIGGYEFVSKKGLWAFVVKELELDLDVSASVKLVYAKYLHELENWLRKSSGEENWGGAGGSNFGFLSLEQEEEFRGLFTNGVDQKVVVNRVALLEYIKNDKFIGKDGENGSKISDANSRYGNDLLVHGPPVARKEFNTRKRKRDSLPGMLNWVLQVAKCPDDPSVAAILEPSKWKTHEGNEFWIQAIRAREALRRKRDDRSVTEQSILQNNLIFGPEQFPSSLDMTAELFGDDSLRKQVFVGSSFQAEVPEWTGMVSDTDSKWLGTKQWPLTDRESDSLAVTDPVGRGRPDSCGCWIPGSVECIRLHIAEKRMKLKLELGSVFYHWRFNGMGEEVSLRWTAEEEKRFKHMVQIESPSLNAFCLDASKYFPKKTRQELVSYYFNVFVIRRRSYQNRVTPKSIDSDDDEMEFGCVSDSFGIEALKVPGSNMLKCSQNNQCMDLE
ncbi:hypothetical protein DITRI_Ditri04bG0128200 [Diplodiscus trichospermus]